jgi:dTDP-4-dehydrorhamnose reductase
MKSLILGARGMIGSALAKQIPDAVLGVSLESTEKNQVYADIVKYETLFRVFSEHRPDIVYLCAAISDVDKCEDLGTNHVNVVGSRNVIRLCEAFNSKLVFFSSSYIFDGKSENPYSVLDEPSPLNNYGIQKHAVERIILTSDARYIIIRTVGVYGEERMKNNFAKAVIDGIFHGRKVFVPKDQFVNPILSNDLAKIAIRLSDREQGVFHVAGDTCLSKSDWARQIAKFFDFGVERLEKLIVPLSSDRMKDRAERPKMACLDCVGLGALGIEVPSFESGLLKFLTLEYV